MQILITGAATPQDPNFKVIGTKLQIVAYLSVPTDITSPCYLNRGLNLLQVNRQDFIENKKLRCEFLNLTLKLHHPKLSW